LNRVNILYNIHSWNNTISVWLYRNRYAD